MSKVYHYYHYGTGKSLCGKAEFDPNRPLEDATKPCKACAKKLPPAQDIMTVHISIRNTRSLHTETILSKSAPISKELKKQLLGMVEVLKKMTA